MKKLTSVLAVTLLLAVTASAATQPCDREFSIFGDYTHTPAAHDDAGGAGIGVSQYIDNNVSVGLQGWWNWGNRGDAAVVGANAKYHFMPTEQVSPYVGGQINYATLTGTDPCLWNSRSTDGMLWGPIVGVAFKVADRTSLFVQYEWQLYQGGIRSAGTKEGSSVVLGMGWGF